MKRIAVLIVAAVVAAGSLSTARAEETRSYLVATRIAPHLLPLEKEFEGREVERFTSVRGYAVELTEAEAEELRRSPEVRWVEPNRERHIWRAPSRPVAGPQRVQSVQANAGTRGQSTPWGITRVHASQLWQMARGEAIKVGVIDTGIDFNHPDLKDLYKGGFNFVENNDQPMDDHGHGTHVAGTIAAIDNDFGVVGVAPKVELYGLRVMKRQEDGGASGRVADIIKAVDWAVANGLHVINLSLGSDDSSDLEAEAFARAETAGVLAVAATGNDHPNTQHIGYPAGYPTVVAVGAIGETDAIAGFSQRGTGIDLVGPGLAVMSTLPVGTGEVADVMVGDQLFEAQLMEGAPRGDVTGTFVYCGLGKPGEFPPAVQGQIALILRGELTFADKVKNAKAAGASAAVIYDNTVGPVLNGTLIKDGNGQVIPSQANFPWILAVGVSKATGEKLRTLTGPMNVNARAFDYGNLQGTSMATPHVAGVAALIWSLDPSATAAQVRLALTDGATDVGDFGWDTTFGFGVVDAVAAAKKLAPQRFPSAPTVRRRPVRP